MYVVACSYDDSLEYCTYDNPEYYQNESNRLFINA